MPDWGLLWNRMNGGDLDRGNRKTDIVVTRTSECVPLRFLHIPPRSGLSGEGGGRAWNASTQTSNRPTQVETSFVSDLCEGPDLSQLTDYTFMRFFLKLRCVWRVGIDRGVHMLTHKWRAKVCRSGVDQLMDHPLIVSGMVLLTQGSGCVSREDHQDSVG